jgi:ubiquinone/menaquinone biosynthesis C-methylase UbiE
MSQAKRTHQGPQDYILGNGAQEQERLKFQASILEKWTEQFFRSAGIERGMNVLDLGCGMGDVSLLAARLVGPAGNVTGIDRDVAIIEKARERVRHHECGANIEFVCSDLFDFEATHPFDAVVGRYVLFFQPDPVAAIAHAARQVRPQGIIVFHELDLTTRIRSCPNGTLFDRMCDLMAETERRAGVWVDLGLHLANHFLNAGLPWPTVKGELPVGGEPGSFIYRWIAETLRSLLPSIERFGLASADELDLDTLAARMEAEAATLQTQLVGLLQFAAWTRIPANSSAE